MAIKIKEIAEIANVSKATVSMVLNNKPGISQKTRDRVLEVAHNYGYEISPLKTTSVKNNGNIQLTIYRKHAKVVGDTPFFQALIEGIESKARHNNYQLIIKYISEVHLDIGKVATELRENAIDGMLLLGTEMKGENLEPFLALNIPVVVLDSYFLGINADYVILNNTNGIYQGVKHLIERGHRDIGYLKSSVPIQNFNERYDAYVKTMYLHNIPYNEAYTVLLGSTMEESYGDMLAYLSGKPVLPTAFVSDNDIIAIGAMKALKEHQIHIPEEVSVIGFDDMPFGVMMDPPLTTVSVDKNTFGRLAVETLLAKMQKNDDYNSKLVLDVLLTQRDSVMDRTPRLLEQI